MKKVMILAVMAFTCLSFSSAMSMQQVANADCAKHQCEKCIKTSACQEKCKEGKDACKSECKEHKGGCKSGCKK